MKNTNKKFEIQRKKDMAYDDKKYKALQKHLNTKIPLTVETFRGLFDDVGDNNVRLEIIKSIIWTADSAYTMWKLVCDKIANEEFGAEID